MVVNDNGGFIEKNQKERVFDKFYRIPTGNQHDVKGFGIGLYYTKKIIEKHGGTIQLVLKPQLTSFEVAIS
ncbi:MAG: two-component system phosphate regulon sensor histidine kinase PhoR [Roseivirga sp.]